MPSHTPKERKKRTLGRASGALSTGGKPLAEMTGNPADATTRPAVGPARKRLGGLLTAGFRRVGG